MNKNIRNKKVSNWEEMARRMRGCGGEGEAV
jgi:hypothetical protein